MRILASCLLLSSLFFLPTSSTIESAEAGPRRVCVDNSKGAVVVKRRCKAPRFTEVTPDILTEAQTLGGFEAGTYLRAGEIFIETYEQEFRFTGESSGGGVDCPDGMLATGGGVSITNNNGLIIRRSIPRGSLSGWIGAVEATKSFATGDMNVYVICSEAYFPSGYAG